MNKIKSKKMLVVVLVLTTIFGCNTPLAPTNESPISLGRIVGAYGISLGNLDQSPIKGLCASYITAVTDSLVPETDSKYANAYMRDVNGKPKALSPITVNSTSLNLSQGRPDTTYIGAGSALSAGGVTDWNLAMSNGVTFSGSCNIPNMPYFTNITPYQTINTTNGFNIQVNSSIAGGEMGLVIMHDGMRNILYGDTSSVTGNAGFKVKYLSSDDDGNIEVPASLVSECYNGRVYTLQIVRFNYLTQARSDGEKVGKLNIVSNKIPVKFQK